MKALVESLGWRLVLVAAFCLLGACATIMENETDIDVQSPSVVAIRKSLAERHAILREHFQAGVIGFTYDGMVALREPRALPDEVRGRIEVLVAEDNKDRGTMYREIARANGRPDWELKLQYVFATRWIGRAPVGWYYRDSSGSWVKKLPPDA